MREMHRILHNKLTIMIMIMMMIMVIPSIIVNIIVRCDEADAPHAWLETTAGVTLQAWAPAQTAAVRTAVCPAPHAHQHLVTQYCAASLWPFHWWKRYSLFVKILILRCLTLTAICLRMPLSYDHLTRTISCRAAFCLRLLSTVMALTFAS